MIADIEPFKGLLMGLFFIAVGMTVDLYAGRTAGLVATLALGLVVGKAIILIFLAGWAACPGGPSSVSPPALPRAASSPL